MRRLCVPPDKTTSVTFHVAEFLVYPPQLASKGLNLIPLAEKFEDSRIDVVRAK
jgi:hypothetical protein